MSPALKPAFPPARYVEMEDRSREMKWLGEHRHEYPGRWLAVDGDRLVVVGATMKEAADMARAAGVEDPFFSTGPGPDDHLPRIGIW